MSINWADDVHTREHYLFFADNFYVSARTLALNDQGLGGVVVASLAVEQYLKLKLYELLPDETEIKKAKHDLVKLFKLVEEPMKINSLPLKPFEYYEAILKNLTEGFQNKYFDESGLIGAMEKNGGFASIGFGKGSLDLFDEICFQLRSSAFLLGGGLIEELLYDEESNPKYILFSLNNKQLENFKKSAKEKRDRLRGYSPHDIFSEDSE